ncbi:TylF/MycF/NovP-related O-methyltransferase [Nioella aestuarii]|uniref:TylF/MycF/NovP-related O-methyltransferase n=1 Tax=Nioella aestuarii TaxID=1662864 RepID=UPI003D7FAF97
MTSPDITRPAITDLNLFKEVLTASCYNESAWQILDAYDVAKGVAAGGDKSLRSRVRRWIARTAKKRGYAVVRQLPFDPARRQGGEDWPLFGYTMVGHKRLDNIEFCLETVLADGIEGDVIETGVWRGGAMMFAKALLDLRGATDRSVWCADSFEGLPKQYGRDLEIADDPELSGSSTLAVTQQAVEANFRRFDLLDDRVKFLKGWFSDTLPTAPVEKIAIARLDGDLYESTMDALVNLYPKVSPGGFVIIDDYGSWKGCRAAVDEYRDEHGIDAPIERIDDHGYFWRVPK